jgi:site-specific recombinase XerD
MHKLQPQEALELYLDKRCTGNTATQTIQSHKSRLSIFVDWCSENNIQYMSDVSGITIHRYRTHRADTINTVTLKKQLHTLRVFLRFCAKLDVADSELHEKVDSVELAAGEGSRNRSLTPERARNILITDTSTPTSNSGRFLVVETSSHSV